MNLEQKTKRKAWRLLTHGWKGIEQGQSLVETWQE